MADNNQKQRVPYPESGSGYNDSEASTAIFDNAQNKNGEAAHSEQQLETLRNRAIENQPPMSNTLLATPTEPPAVDLDMPSEPAPKASTEKRLNPVASSFQPTAVLNNTLNPLLAKYQVLADAQENLKAVQKRYGRAQEKLVAISREVEEAKTRVEEVQAEVMEALRTSLGEMKVLTGENRGGREAEGEQNDDQDGEQ